MLGETAAGGKVEQQAMVRRDRGRLEAGMEGGGKQVRGRREVRTVGSYGRVR